MTDKPTTVINKSMSPISLLLVGITLILTAGKLFEVTPALTELSWWYILPIPFLPLIAIGLVGIIVFIVFFLIGFFVKK